ncbi:alpha/beta hydrolase [Thalassomonas sp. RHCl1]|uniref:alpha/beta fold hydrolase n=1 Tax=Thalassomonas sp. RHCl1 TaxID=2995320 RepID=UPI00248C9449|nr:alpha/beta hydrolase [Thalassomonas sp. RHCl1]
MSKLTAGQIARQYHQGQQDKATFVFVHGNTQNDTCGEGLIDYFQRKGHTTLSYDLPGHGDSPLQTEDYCYSDLIDLNQAILKQYPAKHYILAGHSLGGMIQSGTVGRYKLSNASLLLCGSFDSNPMDERARMAHEDVSEMRKLIHDYVQQGYELFQEQRKFDYYANKALDDDNLKNINRQNTHPTANANNLLTLSGFSARTELVQLGLPMLVLHGEDEDVITSAMIQAMASHYTNMQIAWYPNAGHYAFYQYPELTESYLDSHYDFLIGAD